jgi:hypothetical protein
VTLVPANINAPQAIVAIDPATGSVVGAGVAGYTAISTVGTTTVKATAGVYFGININGTGTTFGVGVYDVVVAGTTTNTLLAPSTYGLGNQGNAGVGIRFTQLVVVTTGTAGNVNVLWD